MSSPEPGRVAGGETGAEAPAISVVVPVYNEARNVEALHARIVATLEATGESWEAVYIDDGSRDTSLEILRGLADRDPRVAVVEFSKNFGQHAAVFAGMAQTRGEAIVTLDADGQNPPEEIPRLVAKLREGYDVVGGWRASRHDSILRKIPSFLVNRVISRATGIQMRDYGCMLRAYRRDIVDRVVASQEVASFIPALANSFARRITEIEVGHAERAHGRSAYSLRRLVHLQFDLMTGFSMFPLHVISAFGMLVAVTGTGFGLFLLVRRLLVGPEVEGVFTLFAILFTFVGAQFLAIGVLGEYVGRIYVEVRRRPRYVIARVHRGGKGEA